MGYGVFPFTNTPPMSYEEVGDYIRSFQRGEIVVNSVPIFPRPPVAGPVGPAPVAAKRKRSPELDKPEITHSNKTEFNDEILRNLLKVTSTLSDGSLVYTRVCRNFISVTHFHIRESRKQRRHDRGVRLGFIRENDREHARRRSTSYSTTYHYAKPDERYFATSVALNKNEPKSIEQVLPRPDPLLSRLSVRTTKGARRSRPMSTEIRGITQWRYVPETIKTESNDWTDLNYDLTPWSLSALSKISSARGVRDHFFFDF